MGVRCEILIIKPKDGFHIAGGLVRGTVKYVIDKAEEYRNITLSLIGKGKVEWTETINKVTTTYTGKEKYVEFNQGLLDKKDSKSTLVEEGTHAFDFNFILPENIPSSFADTTGKISYKLLLEFERDKFFSVNSRYHATLNVRSKFNPSTEPVLFAIEKELTKPFSSKRHRVSLEAEVEKTLVNPGDPFNMIIKVNNENDVNITAVRVELIRYTTYIADNGVEKDVKTIKQSTVETPKVNANSVMEITLTIPTLLKLHSIQYSRILIREYILKVTARLPIPHRNTSVKVPVVIGYRFAEGNEEERFSIPEEDEPPSYWEVMIEDMIKKPD